MRSQTQNSSPSVRLLLLPKDRRPSAELHVNAYGNNVSYLSEIHSRARGAAPRLAPILLAFPYLTIEREQPQFVMYKLILFTYLFNYNHNGCAF